MHRKEARWLGCYNARNGSFRFRDWWTSQRRSRGITSGIPSIGAESIVSLGIFDFGKTKYVPGEFYEGMKRGRIESRDVLLYKDGGRPGEYEPHVSMFGDGFPFNKCCINEHVYRLCVLTKE